MFDSILKLLWGQTMPITIKNKFISLKVLPFLFAFLTLGL